MVETSHPTVPFNEQSSSGIDPRLLEILVCPLSRTVLQYDAKARELISETAKLAFPIRDEIPILLPEEARKLDS